MKYVIYYRVSTKQQGESGLGLEAQKSIIQHFISSQDIVQEFTEVASAKTISDRPVLLEAIEYCQQHGYGLAVAKLDRLSRKTEDALSIYSQLNEKLYSCDIPNLDKFTLTLFMAIADRERELISIRTKAALEEKKKQVGEWRTPGSGFQDSDRLTQSIATNKAKAARNENNRRAASLICQLRGNGDTWYSIADQLNEAGFKTSRGKQFQAVQVQRIYQKFCK